MLLSIQDLLYLSLVSDRVISVLSIRKKQTKLASKNLI